MNNQIIDARTDINIFVSSTFKDMQYERDLLHNRIFPVLNSEALSYGKTINMTDLRWGINTDTLDSENSSKKILSTCFHAIDKCRPYMIVILGNRYGWIPDRQLVHEILPAGVAERMNLDGKSATELEIIYALLNNAQLDHTLFYFRETEGDFPEEYLAESESEEKKLCKLKEYILSLRGVHVSTYKIAWDRQAKKPIGLDEFKQMLISDINSLLRKELINDLKLTEFEKERNRQWNLVYQKARRCHERKEFIDQVEEDLKSHPLQAIMGFEGYGKSTILSRIAIIHQEKGDLVLPVFCGNSASMDNPIEIIKYILDYLESLVGNKQPIEDEEKNTYVAYRKRINKLVDRFSNTSKQRLVILIDAYDQINKTDEESIDTIIPFGLNEKCCVLLTCNEDTELPKTVYRHHLNSLRFNDCISIINNTLDYYGKELDVSVIRSMLSKKNVTNPQYLTLMIGRLLMMNRYDFMLIDNAGGGIDEIISKQIEIVDSLSDSLDALYLDIISTASLDLGNAFVQTALNCIAVTQYGLRESDLEHILYRINKKWESVAFSELVLLLESFFIMRDDGRYDFVSQRLRNELKNRIDDTVNIHKSILDYLDTLPAEDPVRKQEILYHAIYTGNTEYFVKYINENYNNTAIIDTAAMEISRFLNSADADLLINMLRRSCAEDIVKDSFFNHDYLAEFFNLKVEHVPFSTSIKLHKAIVELGKEIVQQYKNPDAMLSLIRSVQKVGNIYLLSNKTHEAKVTFEDAFQLLNVLMDLIQLSDNNSFNEVPAKLAVDLGRSIYTMGRDNGNHEMILSSLKYFDKAIELVKNIPDFESIYNACLLLGLAYYYKISAWKYIRASYKKEYPVEEYINNAINYLERIQNRDSYKEKRRQLLRVYGEAIIYYNQNHEAAAYHKKKIIHYLSEFEENYIQLRNECSGSLTNEIEKNYSLVLKNAALFYFNTLEDTDTALKYAEKAYQCFANAIDETNQNERSRLWDYYRVLIQLCYLSDKESLKERGRSYIDRLFTDIKAVMDINDSFDLLTLQNAIDAIIAMYSCFDDRISLELQKEILERAIRYCRIIINEYPYETEYSSKLDNLKSALRELDSVSPEEKKAKELSNLAIEAYSKNDLKTAFKHFYEAAMAGDPISMLNLGVMYTSDDVVPRDLQQALYWFEKAAAEGIETAARYAEMAKKQLASDDIKEFFQRGIQLYSKGDYAGAFPWFEKAAQLGDPQSQFILGNMYDFGESVSVNDEKAYYWYLKAAEQNHVDALFNVGVFYERGRFVKQDIEKAVYYYRKAARLGSKRALQASREIEAFLARKYFEWADDYYVEGKTEQAIPLFEKSGQYGSHQAYYNLGVIFAKGEGGVKSDMARAKAYFEKSAGMGDSLSKEILRKFFT